jgi:hypothetical protein
LNNVSDESQMSLDARKYYVQSYDFTMLGYLIDEEEFEVKPAIARVSQVFEVQSDNKKKKRKIYPENPDEFGQNFLFVSGNTVLSGIVDFTVDMTFISSNNINTFDVFINGDYYGTDLNFIQVTLDDVLRIEVVKNDDTLDGNILFENKLV